MIDNLDFEENCWCKFNACKFYEYNKDKCLKDICVKLEK